MDKRYQVFVSSTYADLQAERQKVIQALMEMDCIPAGMEIFPAADEEQWQFIKRVIDDCDYYLLIIGGRYGSTDSDGLSYTEKEYDYAVEQGLKVIALIHSNPDEIPAGKTDQDPELAERLVAFRERIAEGRLVKFWDNADQLPGMVALSLSKTIKTYPATGWVRADHVASEELWKQVNELTTENAELKRRIQEYEESAPGEIEDLAGLDDSFEVFGTYRTRSEHPRRQWSIQLTWSEIFALISPYLIENPNDDAVKLKLKNAVFEKTGKSVSSKEMNDQCFQTIKIQLCALNLIKVRYSKTTKGGMALFWSLTSMGETVMMRLRAVRKTSEKEH